MFKILGESYYLDFNELDKQISIEKVVTDRRK